MQNAIKTVLNKVILYRLKITAKAIVTGANLDIKLTF